MVCRHKTLIHLLPLLIKDYHWHKKHKLRPFLLFALPLLFSLFPAHFHKGDYTTLYVKESIMSHEIGLPPPVMVPYNIQVILPPTFTDEDLADFKDFCIDLCGVFTIKRMSLEELYKTKMPKDVHGYVILENYDAFNKKLKYRFVDFLWSIKKKITPTWGIWSIQENYFRVRFRGYNYVEVVQMLIESKFVKDVLSNDMGNASTASTIDDDEKENYTNSSSSIFDKVVRHRVLPLFNHQSAVVYILMSHMSIILALPGIWQFGHQLNEERHSGCKELMSTLAVSRRQYFASYLIIYYFSFLLNQLLLWVPLINSMENGGIDINVVIPGCIIMAANLSTFSMLLGTVFRKMSYLRIGSVAIILISCLKSLTLSDNAADTPNFVWSCFLFPTAYHYYLRSASTRYTAGGILQTTPTPLTVLPYLILSFVVMTVMTGYLDRVFPGGTLTGQPFYFVIKKEYWKPKMKEPLNEPDAYDDETQIGQPESSPNKKSPAVVLKGVCKASRKMWIVNRVSMTINPGEVTLLYGPRGGGGLEILQIIAGQVNPDYGCVVYKENNIRPTISYFAGQWLFPQLTVAQMCKLVADIRGVDSKDNENMMEDLSLLEHKDVLISKLNVCQKQQLMLLLAFIGDYELILVDEPTLHCPPGIRNAMYAFILTRSANKAVVVSSYDPNEADSVDTIAFLSYGRLLCFGSVRDVKKKYAQKTNITIWPSAGFEMNAITQIQGIINKYLKPSEICEWEMLPNESHRFAIPYSNTLPINEILRDIDKKTQELGITYTELCRQNLQDAYYNCSLQRVEFKIAKEEEIEELGTLYNAEKSNAVWPELSLIFSMRIHYYKQKRLISSAFLILPFVFALIVFSSVFVFWNTCSEIELNPHSFGDRLNSEIKIMTNMDLTSDKFKKIPVSNIEELLNGTWIYENPPITGAIFKQKDLVHIFSQGQIHFSNLLLNNIYSRKLLEGGSIDFIAESFDQEKWAHVLAKEKVDAWNSFTNRFLVLALITQWQTAICFAVLILANFVASGVFIAKLANDNCMNMHFLMGANPLRYWAAIAFIDFLQFLIFLVLIVCAMFACGNTFAAVEIAIVFAFMAFVGFLPFTYLFGLWFRSEILTFLMMVFCTGFGGMYPALFSTVSPSFSLQLESYSETIWMLSYFFPPCAATIGVSVGSFHVNTKVVTIGESLKALGSLMVSCAANMSWWIVFALIGSTNILAALTKLRFWWERMKIHPNDLIQNTSNYVSFAQNDTARPGSDQREDITPIISSDSTSQANDEKIVARSRTSAGMEKPYTKEDFMMLEKTIQMTPTSTIPKPQTSKQEGLWERRLKEASPVITFEDISLGHYAEHNDVSLCVKETHALHIFGDVPEMRSALLDMAAAQSYPNTGVVKVKGKKADIRSGCGYVPRDERLFSLLSGRKTLYLAGKLAGYKDPKPIVDFILKITNLKDVANWPIEKYGISDRRMLAFAVAVIKKPTALILDELDVYLGPVRMRIAWKIVRFLRDKYKVPVLFSTSRVWESEAASSHTGMLFVGTVSIYNTTLDIKRMFNTLALLTITLQDGGDKELLKKIVLDQIDKSCLQPHPHPSKLCFLVTIPDGKYVEIQAQVRSLMTTIGMCDYQLDTPALDTIYSANFTCYQ